MAFTIIILICATISLLVAKVEGPDIGDRVFAGSMAFVLSCTLGSIFAFLIIPMTAAEYKTEWVKPLAKMESGEYVKLVPQDGDPAFIFRPKGGYVQVLREYDDDSESVEVNYYQTYKTPRVEKRCGYIEDWVFPWKVSRYGDFHGCDINLYVPAHKGVMLK